MSRSDGQRLLDILVAIEAIDGHMAKGELENGLVFDAVRMRIIEIGESARALGNPTKSRAPQVPWSDIAGMRNHVVHRYFDTNYAIVENSVRFELPRLQAAVAELLGGITEFDRGDKLPKNT